MPRQTVTPYLLYEDAAGALDWLSRVFGFRETTRFEASGSVSHAEMAVGRDGEVFLGAPGGGFMNPRNSGHRSALVYVYVDDVDEHFSRAKEAGAAIIAEPADQEYGERRYAAEDLEGHQWFFAAPVRQAAEAEPAERAPAS
jgi:uncharacterized glyoxalase superfamily protein PhnB